MIALSELQQSFHRIAQEKGLEVNLRSTSIKVQVDTVADMGELINRIQQFSAESGWIAAQSHQIMLDEWRSTPQRFGAILQAELAKENISLHVRQARSGWTVTQLEEDSLEPNCLVEHRVVPSTREQMFLHYHVYWQPLDDLGLRATCYRFTGMMGE